MPYWTVTVSLAVINGLHEGSLKTGLGTDAPVVRFIEQREVMQSTCVEFCAERVQIYKVIGECKSMNRLKTPNKRNGVDEGQRLHEDPGKQSPSKSSCRLDRPPSHLPRRSRCRCVQPLHTGAE
jgi:hypothetical protein